MGVLRCKQIACVTHNEAYAQRERERQTYPLKAHVQFVHIHVVSLTPIPPTPYTHIYYTSIGHTNTSNYVNTSIHRHTLTVMCTLLLVTRIYVCRH